MNDLSIYNSVRPSIRAGDVIAFAGTEIISDLIHTHTGSPVSHLAIVRQPAHGSLDVMISESTIEGDRNGVQSNPLGETLANYGDGASAALLALSDEVRKDIDWFKFYEFIGACDGFVKYDIEGLFGFLGRNLPLIGPLICQDEDPKQMFCNAYVVAVLEACGVLRGINWRKLTPQDCCEMRLYKPDYVQLLPTPLTIERYNRW